MMKNNKVFFWSDPVYAIIADPSTLRLSFIRRFNP